MLLEFKGVAKDYQLGRVQVPALRDVNLSVAAGDFLVINGPSGSGKSTFLNIAACIDKPTAGEVMIEDVSTSAMGERRLAALRLHTIGLIFQSFNLIPVLSAWENVEYPLRLQGVPTAERRARVDEIMNAVGLAGFARRRPDELSGGQRQRVGIARALVARPALILADEPTANLDSKTSELIMGILSDLNARYHVAIIVVTHDQLVNKYAARLAHIKDGRLTEVI